MLKEERYDKILQILEEETYVSAEVLSQRLFVSMPTIRRDLAHLQKRNLIIRSHGGAKKLNSEHIVTPIDYRKSQNFAQKRAIARKAASLIKDGNIIFIDASTTALNLADFLDDKSGITIVTNGIPLSIALSQKGIKTFSTGGEIQKSSLGYAGSFAQNFVRSFNYDICFFSVSALDNTGNVCDSSLEENLVRKAAIESSKKCAFLCDKSKIGLSAPYNLIHKDNIDYIFTD